MSEQVLITGGAGFIGSNFVQLLAKVRPDWKLVVVDQLTYAGNLENLKDIAHAFTFVHADICDETKMRAVCEQHRVSGIINFAAESHVDRSILGPKIFVQTNVSGTQSLLEVARGLKIGKFLQVSTDEVYGSLGPKGLFTEETPLSPNSPYSASKAGADVLVRAYHHTFGLHAVITRCSNNYGPYQFPEKLIPLMIVNAQKDQALPVYGDGKNVRDWLHVADHAEAILLAYEKGRPGEVYNIGGNNEWANIDIVKTVLDLLHKPHSLIQFVKDRPGHDRRYAIDATKIKSELGWAPRYRFAEGIKETVAWYLAHTEWVQRVQSGAYQKYYQEQYGLS